jgi:hypothetical protein
MPRFQKVLRHGGPCGREGTGSKFISTRVSSVFMVLMCPHLGSSQRPRGFPSPSFMYRGCGRWSCRRRDFDCVVLRDHLSQLGRIPSIMGGIDCARWSRHKAGSLLTLRWSKRDSNPQSPVARRGQAPRRQIFRKRPFLSRRECRCLVALGKDHWAAALSRLTQITPEFERVLEPEACLMSPGRVSTLP